jgi:hypothetical protein
LKDKDIKRRNFKDKDPKDDVEVFLMRRIELFHTKTVRCIPS